MLFIHVHMYAVSQPMVCVTNNFCSNSSVCLQTYFCDPEAIAALLREQRASMCIKVIVLVLILSVQCVQVLL